MQDNASLEGAADGGQQSTTTVPSGTSPTGISHSSTSTSKLHVHPSTQNGKKFTESDVGSDHSSERGTQHSPLSSDGMEFQSNSRKRNYEDSLSRSSSFHRPRIPPYGFGYSHSGSTPPIGGRPLHSDSRRFEERERDRERREKEAAEYKRRRGLVSKWKSRPGSSSSAASESDRQLGYPRRQSSPTFSHQSRSPRHSDADYSSSSWERERDSRYYTGDQPRNSARQLSPRPMGSSSYPSSRSPRRTSTPSYKSASASAYEYNRGRAPSNPGLAERSPPVYKKAENSPPDYLRSRSPVSSSTNRPRFDSNSHHNIGVPEVSSPYTPATHPSGRDTLDYDSSRTAKREGDYFYSRRPPEYDRSFHARESDRTDSRKYEPPLPTRGREKEDGRRRTFDRGWDSNRDHERRDRYDDRYHGHYGSNSLWDSRYRGNSRDYELERDHSSSRIRHLDSSRGPSIPYYDDMSPDHPRERGKPTGESDRSLIPRRRLSPATTLSAVSRYGEDAERRSRSRSSSRSRNTVSPHQSTTIKLSQSGENTPHRDTKDLSQYNVSHNNNMSENKDSAPTDTQKETPKRTQSPGEGTHTSGDQVDEKPEHASECLDSTTQNKTQRPEISETNKDLIEPKNSSSTSKSPPTTSKKSPEQENGVETKTVAHEAVPQVETNLHEQIGETKLDSVGTEEGKEHPKADLNHPAVPDEAPVEESEDNKAQNDTEQEEVQSEVLKTEKLTPSENVPITSIDTETRKDHEDETSTQTITSDKSLDDEIAINEIQTKLKTLQKDIINQEGALERLHSRKSELQNEVSLIDESLQHETLEEKDEAEPMRGVDVALDKMDSINTKSVIADTNDSDYRLLLANKERQMGLRKGLFKYALCKPVKSLQEYEIFHLNEIKHEKVIEPFLLAKLCHRRKELYQKGYTLQRQYCDLRKSWLEKCEALDLESFDNNTSSTRERSSEPPPGTNNDASRFGPNAGSETRKVGRGSRHGDTVRSEAEFLEILASLERETAKDPSVRAVRTSAVIPNMILDPKERERERFIDTNNLIVDKSVPYQRLFTDGVDNFSSEEQKQFCEAFLKHPKQFGKISSLMGGSRSASECVLHYYRTKKACDYKGMLAAKSKRSNRKTLKRSGTKERLHGPSSVNVPSSSVEESGAVHVSEPDGEKIAPSEPHNPSHEEAELAAARASEISMVDKNGHASVVIKERNVEASVPDGGKKRKSTQSEVQVSINEKRPKRSKTSRTKAKEKKEEEEFSGAKTLEATEDSVPPDEMLKREEDAISALAGMAAFQQPVATVYSDPSSNVIAASAAFPPNNLTKGSRLPVPLGFTAPSGLPTTIPLASLPNLAQSVMPAQQHTTGKRQSTTSSYWSVHEMELFPKLLASFGSQWEEISKCLKTKSAVMVKNYYTRNAGKLGWDEILRNADETLAKGEPTPEPPITITEPFRRRQESIHRAQRSDPLFTGATLSQGASSDIHQQASSYWNTVTGASNLPYGQGQVQSSSIQNLPLPKRVSIDEFPPGPRLGYFGYSNTSPSEIPQPTVNEAVGDEQGTRSVDRSGVPSPTSQPTLPSLSMLTDAVRYQQQEDTRRQSAEKLNQSENAPATYHTSNINSLLHNSSPEAVSNEERPELIHRQEDVPMMNRPSRDTSVGGPLTSIGHAERAQSPSTSSVASSEKSFQTYRFPRGIESGRTNQSSSSSHLAPLFSAGKPSYLDANSNLAYATESDIRGSRASNAVTVEEYGRSTPPENKRMPATVTVLPPISSFTTDARDLTQHNYGGPSRDRS